MKFLPWIIIGVLATGYAYYEYDRQYNFPQLDPPSPEFVYGGVNRGGIPALTDPDYESVLAADPHLSDDGFGVVVEGSGQAYFYPLVILAWHEVINETIAGVPIAISYCPLCHSSVTYERTIEDQIVELEASGQLLDNNLVMVEKEGDRLWPQLASLSELKVYPSSQITFGQFKQDHPDCLVLSRNTGYERDYTQDPYWLYYKSDDIKFTLSNLDGRLPAKEMIYGSIESGNKPIASLNNEDEAVPSYWFCWVAAYPETKIIEDDYEL